MGCHLHDLIESLEKNTILCIDPISNRDFDEIIRVVKNVAPDSICFDMGNIDGFPEISPVYEMVKEPYPTCWFEFNFIHTDGSQIVLGMLVVVRDEVQITSFRRKHKQWTIRGVILCDSLSSWNNYEIFPAVDIVAEELKQHKIVLSTFLTALNCRNVKKIEHQPNKKIQKARKKRKKHPLFSHWTLELSIPSNNQEKNSKANGTHTSPRVHLRRGHPRQYAPGKWTWVQPCIVGKSKGIITKDYSTKFINT